MSEFRLTPRDHGSAVSAHTGDTIVVELPEIPATGYRWAVASDNSILSVDQDNFQISNAETVGGGGIRIFHFTARRPDDFELRLTLVRPWQPNLVRETFRVRVHITASPQ